MSRFGQELHKAVVFAAMAHKGQVRKSTEIDYLSHPMEVLQILAAMNASENLQIAGVLHDVLEDTEITEEQLKIEFGDAVTDLVAGHSEDKDKSWKERKTEDLKKVSEGSRELKMLVLADRLANVRSMYADFQQIGDNLWSRFNAGKDSQAWYLRAALEALAGLENDPDTESYFRELKDLEAELFQPKAA